MSRKALIIVALVVVIAVSAGSVIYAVNHHSGNNADAAKENTPPAETTVTDTTDQNDTAATDDPTVDATDAPVQTPTEEPTDDSDPNGYSDAVVSAGTYHVDLVYDHTTGEEVLKTVVFGKLYSYCALTFGEDGTVELCLNPSADEVRKGSYRIYGSVISVVYDDGAGSEYNLITDEDGDIDYIIVNYGDYDVYFSAN